RSAADSLRQQFLLSVDVKDQFAWRPHAGGRTECELLFAERANGAQCDAVDEIEVLTLAGERGFLHGRESLGESRIEGRTSPIGILMTASATSSNGVGSALTMTTRAPEALAMGTAPATG